MENYQSVGNSCEVINGQKDLTNFIKRLNPEKLNQLVPTRQYLLPTAALDDSDIPPVSDSFNLSHLLQNELIVDGMSKLALLSKREAIKNEMSTLENKISQLDETIESIGRLQSRSIETSLFNKASELQEDLSQKTYDRCVALIHLAALRAQVS